MTDNTRYRAAPFKAVRGRSGNRVVLRHATGERRAIPDGAFAVLDSIYGFRTLHEHAKTAAARIANMRGLESQIMATLEDLRKQGLLISAEDFLRLAGSGGGGAGGIRTIGIPARIGSGLVERCVKSYSAHARRFGRGVRFVISGPEAREIAGEQVAWFDSARIEALVGDLGRAGIDTAVARFALKGEAGDLPPGIARTTGANRNVLFLATQGEPFLSVDDDTICTLFHAPHPRTALGFLSRGTPFDMWFDTNLPEPPETLEVDLMAELGHALGPALAITAGRELPLSSGEFEHRTMEKLCSRGAAARAAQLGLSGDAATESPAGWLTVRGPSRERLVPNEAEYRRNIASRRIFTASAQPVVTDSAMLMGYCTALDNRAVLPPFPPLGRDQDGVFALWLRIVDPLSFTVFLPYSITHEPEQTRAFDADAMLRGTRGMLLNDAVRSLLRGLDDAGPQTSVASRIAWLGNQMLDYAEMDAADFRMLLTERRLDAFPHAIAYYENSLAIHGSRPAWWARDMQMLIRACEEAMTGPGLLRVVESGSARGIGNDLAVVQSYVRWCGRLLREWPLMCAAASEIAWLRGFTQ